MRYLAAFIVGVVLITVFAAFGMPFLLAAVIGTLGGLVVVSEAQR